MLSFKYQHVVSVRGFSPWHPHPQPEALALDLTGAEPKNPIISSRSSSFHPPTNNSWIRPGKNAKFFMYIWCTPVFSVQSVDDYPCGELYLCMTFECARNMTNPVRNLCSPYGEGKHTWNTSLWGIWLYRNDLVILRPLHNEDYDVRLWWVTTVTISYSLWNPMKEGFRN